MNTQISNLSQVTVAILAGGFGTRLKSIIKRKPKVLAQVRKHPFLEYLLHQLNQANFKQAVLCTGYLSDHIEKAFGRKYKNLHLLYSPEQTPLGTAGSLRKALPLLASETVLVMNGDSFCAVDFRKFWQFHLRKKSKASLVLSFVSNASRFGKVKLRSNDSIIEFQENKAESGSGFMNAGIYLIHKSFIARIPERQEISIEKDVFTNWIGKGFYGYKSNNKFIDIGMPESYAQAEHFFATYKL